MRAWLAAGGAMTAIASMATVPSAPVIAAACTLLGIIIAQATTWARHRGTLSANAAKTVAQRVGELEEKLDEEMEKRAREAEESKMDRAVFEFQLTQLRMGLIESLHLWSYYRNCSQPECPIKDDPRLLAHIRKIEKLLEDPYKDVPVPDQFRSGRDGAARLMADIESVAE